MDVNLKRLPFIVWKCKPFWNYNNSSGGHVSCGSGHRREPSNSRSQTRRGEKVFRSHDCGYMLRLEMRQILKGLKLRMMGGSNTGSLEVDKMDQGSLVLREGFGRMLLVEGGFRRVTAQFLLPPELRGPMVGHI